MTNLEPGQVRTTLLNMLSGPLGHEQDRKVWLTEHHGQPFWRHVVAWAATAWVEDQAVVDGFKFTTAKVIAFTKHLEQGYGEPGVLRQVTPRRFTLRWGTKRVGFEQAPSVPVELFGCTLNVQPDAWRQLAASELADEQAQTLADRLAIRCQRHDCPIAECMCPSLADAMGDAGRELWAKLSQGAEPLPATTVACLGCAVPLAPGAHPWCHVCEGPTLAELRKAEHPVCVACERSGGYMTVEAGYLFHSTCRPRDPVAFLLERAEAGKPPSPVFPAGTDAPVMPDPVTDPGAYEEAAREDVRSPEYLAALAEGTSMCKCGHVQHRHMQDGQPVNCLICACSAFRAGEPEPLVPESMNREYKRSVREKFAKLCDMANPRTQKKAKTYWDCELCGKQVKHGDEWVAPAKSTRKRGHLSCADATLSEIKERERAEAPGPVPAP